jgi:hypothetical protein
VGLPGRLSDRAIRALREPGRYGDGNNLFLTVSATGSKSWLLRIQRGGRRRDLGLGRWPDVPLALARARAVEIRQALALGRDPVLLRQQREGVPTLAAAIEAARLDLGRAWKGGPDGRTGRQWQALAGLYVTGPAAAASVDAIDEAAVRDLLAPIWATKPETGRKLFGMIRQTID